MATVENQTIELNAAALTASLHVEKASFDQVVFQNVAETYEVGNDIDLTYTVGLELEVSSRDWVGLYQVGWRSTDNYIWYEWSPLPSSRAPGKQSEIRVVFPAAKLPKDDGEFYQFCYITSKSKVRGLSSPFQFRKPVSCSSSLDDLIEIEDENGELLIIKTKTAYLDDQLKKANEKCTMLNQDVRLLESEKEVLVLSKQDVERKLLNVTEENGVLKKQILHVKEQMAKLGAEVDSLKMSVFQLSEMNSNMNMEKQQIERTLALSKSCIAEHESTKKALQNEKDAILGQLKSLEEEKALYKIHFTSSESAIQAHVSRITELQTQLAESQEAASAMVQQRVELDSGLAELTAQLEERVVDGEKIKQTVKLLEERLAEVELELSAKEKREIELNNELSSAVETNLLLQSDVESSKNEVDALKSQLERLSAAHSEEHKELLCQLEQCVSNENQEKKEKEKFAAEVSDLRIQLEETAALAGADSALYALNAAHSVLKDRYFKLEKKVTQQQVLLDQSAVRSRELEDEVSAGQRDITQLKARLQMGLEQYKEKVVECLKLQDSCQRSKKSENKLNNRSPTNEESDMLSHLQAQMQDAAVELECRNDRLKEMALHLSNEAELRSSAEIRVCVLEQELQAVKDVLAKLTGGITTPTVVHQPLQTQTTQNKIYPELCPELSTGNAERTISGSSSNSSSNVLLHVPSAGASWSTSDVAAVGDSLPPSPGDVLPVCPLCHFQFPQGVSTGFISAHIDMHYVGEMCPLCNAKFPAKSPQYEAHVQGHFTN